MADSQPNELSPDRKKSTGTLKLAEEFVSISSPAAMQQLADTLKTFIVENKLFTELGTAEESKKHVHVEGWQFAGASMGIFPQVIETRRIEEQGEVKFSKKVWYKDSNGKNKYKYEDATNPIYKHEAIVELINITTGRVVGRGVAICSNQEAKKRTFDEYAIQSMAETRATGKAFRLCLGWIVKLAGYEGTPAEEVDDESTDPEDATVQPTVVEIPFEDVKLLVDLALTRMSPADKIKFIKDWTGSISDKKLTEQNYRVMYENLPRKDVGNE